MIPPPILDEGRCHDLKCRLAATGGHAREQEDVKRIVPFGVATSQHAQPPDDHAAEDQRLPPDFVNVVSAEEQGYCITEDEGSFRERVVVVVVVPSCTFLILFAKEDGSKEAR